jgi:serine/threonine protein kinase
LAEDVAIKFFSGRGTVDDEDEKAAFARFQREALVTAKLARKSQHIVSVFDHGEHDGVRYLVMDLVDGESLDVRMRREGHLEVDEVAPIVLQVSRGLAHAHREGMIHRGLKPANIVLTRDDRGELVVKVLDFGIAKTSGMRGPGETNDTGIGVALGTPSYMSPEQTRGKTDLDHRCDLWALAAIAYEALSGALPFAGENLNDLAINICSTDPLPIRTHRSALPASLDTFFARAFASNIADRFQDAHALADAFVEAARGTPYTSDEWKSAPDASKQKTIAPPNYHDIRREAERAASTGRIKVDVTPPRVELQPREKTRRWNPGIDDAKLAAAGSKSRLLVVDETDEVESPEPAHQGGLLVVPSQSDLPPKPADARRMETERRVRATPSVEGETDREATSKRPRERRTPAWVWFLLLMACIGLVAYILSRGTRVLS